MHVPVDRRASFDRAIDEIAQDGPLYRIFIEADSIQIAEQGKAATRRFEVDGHLAWAAPTPADD